MTARVSMLLKSRASLTCFRACFLPSWAKDLSAPGIFYSTHMNIVWLLQGYIEVTGERNLSDFMTISHELCGCEMYCWRSLCFLHFFGGDLRGMIKINET